MNSGCKKNAKSDNSYFGLKWFPVRSSTNVTRVTFVLEETTNLQEGDNFLGQSPNYHVHGNHNSIRSVAESIHVYNFQIKSRTNTRKPPPYNEHQHTCARRMPSIRGPNQLNQFTESSWFRRCKEKGLTAQWWDVHRHPPGRDRGRFEVLHTQWHAGRASYRCDVAIMREIARHFDSIHRHYTRGDTS